MKKRTKWSIFLARLLEHLELDRDLAMKVLDWIDPDQARRIRRCRRRGLYVANAALSHGEYVVHDHH